jgi:hypothetical protein
MRSMISVMFRIALTCLLGASMIMRSRPVLRAVTRSIMIMLAATAVGSVCDRKPVVARPPAGTSAGPWPRARRRPRSA